MDWQDEGCIIAVRAHGESAAIIEVFTAAHGRHAGVVRGGASRRMAAVLQPGSQVTVQWHARLSEHIGVFSVEPLHLRSALMADRLALAGLTAICAMVHVCLPEREAYPGLWRFWGIWSGALTGRRGICAGRCCCWRRSALGWIWGAVR